MKTIVGNTLLVAAILFAAAGPTPAQDVNLARLEPGDDRFHTSVGLDPAVVTTVGYSRAFGLVGGTVLWDLDLGLAAAQADVEDVRARTGLQGTLWRGGDLYLGVRGRLTARRTSNAIYDGAGFGGDLTASFGYYRRGWFAAGLLGYDYISVMHIQHSDWYRENFYAEAVDGWYRGGGGIMHGGAAAGFAAGSAEFAARVEWRRLSGGETLDPPLVGTLSLAVEF